MFRQIHAAGDLAASDFTHMNTLNITIAGQRFDHMVYHFVLTYPHDLPERDRKLEDARERRRLARQAEWTNPTTPSETGATVPNESIPHHPLSPPTASDNSNSG